MGKMSQEQVSVDLFDEVKRLQEENSRLNSSLLECKKENDTYKTSTHIDTCEYDLIPNENGEILAVIKVHGVEHTLGITEKDSRWIASAFEMNKKK